MQYEWLKALPTQLLIVLNGIEISIDPDNVEDILLLIVLNGIEIAVVSDSEDVLSGF